MNFGCIRLFKYGLTTCQLIWFCCLSQYNPNLCQKKNLYRLIEIYGLSCMSYGCYLLNFIQQLLLENNSPFACHSVFVLPQNFVLYISFASYKHVFAMVNRVSFLSNANLISGDYNCHFHCCFVHGLRTQINR